MGGPGRRRAHAARPLLTHARLIVAVALLVAGCDRDHDRDHGAASSPASAEAPVGGPHNKSPPPVAVATADRDALDLEALVTVAALRKDVEMLAADTLGGRATPSPGLDAAADILAARYRELGLTSPPGITDYRQTFSCGGALRPGDAANVVARVAGTDKDAPAVIVSAHYDHIGSRPGRPDPVFNGANDNASGVASMLAIAKVVASLDPPPARSVMFVAFCGEELGLEGSSYFAEHPPVALDTVVANINLEMLGRPDPKFPARLWITGFDYSTLPALARKANAGQPVTFVSSAEIGPAEGSAFNRSDNFPLAKQGVVAHSFSTGAIDRYYHAADDEAATMDFDAMAPIVRGLARLVVYLADGAHTPEWTDAGRDAGFLPEP